MIVEIEMKNHLSPILASALALTAGVASAQDLGYVGLSYEAIEGTGDAPAFSTGEASVQKVEAMFAYELANGSRVAFEGSFFQYEGEGDDYFDRNVDVGAEIAAHYLRDAMNGQLTYGAYAAYGEVDADALDSDEQYDYYSIGVQASYNVNDAFTVYGQLGFVDRASDPNDSEEYGFSNGAVVRLGGIYSGFSGTSLYGDLQVGGSESYANDDQPGEMYRVTLGGETQLGAGGWAVTYAVTKEGYRPIGDDDNMEATSFTLGARYYFGGTTGSDVRDAGFIGSPDLMQRASSLVAQF